MSLAKKTAVWVQHQIISAEQQKNILDFERARSNKTFWNSAFIVAGSLIGLGLCLLIAANWKVLPSAVKLTGDFALLGGLIYAVWHCKRAGHNGLKELFAVLAFLLVGGTIGLIGQVFQLSGGWSRFALAWALLGLPYVLLSRSGFINTGWLLLLITAVRWESLLKQLESVWHLLSGMAVLVLSAYLLHLFLCKLAEAADPFTVLPRAAARLALWAAYGLLGGVAVAHGLIDGKIGAYALVFGFLAYRMYAAARAQQLKSFKRNAVLAEIYIFCIFAFKMGSLWKSGFGFIGAGMFLLAFIVLLRKTTRYIKQMEIFK